MSRRPTARIVGAGMLAVCLMAAPAAAQQQRGSRLPSGLFGGGVGEAEQVLDFGVSAGGGSNRTRLVSGTTPALDNRFGHASASLRYMFSRSRVGLWASGATSAHYSSTGTRLPMRHVVNGGASFTLPVTGRTNLNLSQSASYQPVQIVSTLPGLAVPGLGIGPQLPLDPELATTRDGFVTADSHAQLGYQLSRRTGLSMDAGYQQSGRLSSPTDLRTARGGIRLTRALGRGLDLRFGYAYTRGFYSGAAQAATFDHHHVDLGVDYDRSLSLTRRATVSFSTGSVVLSDGVQHRFHINGSARLNYAVGQGWRASLAYRRASEFVGTFQAPVSADSLAAGLSGFLLPRVHASGTFGAARGSVGLSGGNDFTTYYGSTGLTVGLTSYLGLDVTYSYYRSEFASGALLTPGVPAHFNRQSLRASVRLWAPLLHRVGRTNAAG